jgi:hypothetical protein
MPAVTSADRVQLLSLDQIVELIPLPFAATQILQRMGGLQLTLTGLRQSTAQAAAPQLRRPAMEAVKVSSPCHEHLLVVTAPV